MEQYSKAMQACDAIDKRVVDVCCYLWLQRVGCLHIQVTTIYSAHLNQCFLSFLIFFILYFYYFFKYIFYTVFFETLNFFELKNYVVNLSPF